MTRVVYPGTFDPVTRGHLDVIRRAAAMFDEVIVGVGNNPSKKTAFSLRERADMMRREVRGLENVSVRTFGGLVGRFARDRNASFILRGVRTAADFEYEIQMAIANRASAGIETIFMTPSPEVEFISGRLIKEIVGMGGNADELVSPDVAKKLRAKLRRARRKK